jgi:uncharacterized protein YceH (UPF0502 family)
MIQLTPLECRVLGVLIEKAQTTPAQYPLTLNAIVSGSNQKSNRDPVLALSDEQVVEALDALRGRSLVREVMLSGSRVEKFRHVAREALDVSTSELVVLAELLLRGPQTVGELRTRASRMHSLESIDVVNNVLEHLMSRDEPLARKLAPAPGSRAPRYAQLLCPDLHPLEAPAAAVGGGTTASVASDAGLAARVEALERRVETLSAKLELLGRSLESGASEPRSAS